MAMGILMTMTVVFTACDLGSSAGSDSSATGGSSSVTEVSSSAGNGNSSSSGENMSISKTSIAVDKVNHVVVIYEPSCTLSGGKAIYDAKGDGIPWNFHYAISNDTLVLSAYSRMLSSDTATVWTVDSSKFNTETYVGSSDDIFGTWTKLDLGDGTIGSLKISEDSTIEVASFYSCPIESMEDEYEYDIVDSIDCYQAVVSIEGVEAVLKVENSSTAHISYSVTNGTVTCIYTETYLEEFPDSLCTVENLENGYIEHDAGDYYYKTNSENFESCMQTITSENAVATKKAARLPRKSRLRLKSF